MAVRDERHLSMRARNATTRLTEYTATRVRYKTVTYERVLTLFVPARVFTEARSSSHVSPLGPARTPLPVHEPTRSHMRPAETGLETETDTSPAETEHGIGAEHGIETDRGTDPVKRAVGMLPADPGLGEKVPVIMLTAANCDRSGPSLELPAAESGHGDGEADTPPSMGPPTPYCIGDIECRCADARIAPAGKSLKPAGLDTR